VYVHKVFSIVRVFRASLPIFFIVTFFLWNSTQPRATQEADLIRYDRVSERIIEIKNAMLDVETSVGTTSPVPVERGRWTEEEIGSEAQWQQMLQFILSRKATISKQSDYLTIERSNRLMGVLRTPSYMVFIDINDRSMVKAMNTKTGSIDYSSTDAKTVIQSAINALPRDGGQIFAKAGTYFISSSIQVNRSNVWIAGEGRGHTVLQAADAALLSTNLIDFLPSRLSNIRIENLTVDGNKAHNADLRDDDEQCLIASIERDLTDIYLINVEVRNSPRHGIRLVGGTAGGTKGVHCINVLAHDNGEEGIEYDFRIDDSDIINSKAYKNTIGMGIYGSHNFSLIGGEAYDNGGANVQIAYSGSQNAFRNRVTGVNIHHSSVGIDIWGDVDMSTFEFNTIYNHDSNNGFGIFISGKGPSRRCEDNVVARNVIDSVLNKGITFDRYADRNFVVENMVMNSRWVGIDIANSTVNDTLVVDNLLDKNETPLRDNGTHTQFSRNASLVARSGTAATTNTAISSTPTRYITNSSTSKLTSTTRPVTFLSTSYCMTIRTQISRASATEITTHNTFIE